MQLQWCTIRHGCSCSFAARTPASISLSHQLHVDATPQCTLTCCRCWICKCRSLKCVGQSNSATWMNATSYSRHSVISPHEDGSSASHSKLSLIPHPTIIDRRSSRIIYCGGCESVVDVDCSPDDCRCDTSDHNRESQKSGVQTQPTPQPRHCPCPCPYPCPCPSPGSS